MTTLDRIKVLCKENGINITTLENKCGFSQNSIVKWAKTSPSVDKIISVARYFNVSADYLLCLTDELKPLENREIAERQTTALSTEFAELSQDKDFVDTAKLYKEMPKPDRRAICAYVIGLAQGVLGMARVNQILGRYL